MSSHHLALVDEDEQLEMMNRQMLMWYLRMVENGYICSAASKVSLDILQAISD